MDTIDSTATFQHFQKIWKIAGRNPSSRYPQFYLIYSVFINLTINVFLPTSVIIEMFRLENIEALMKDIVFYVEIIVTSLKFFTLWFYQDKFSDVNRLLSYLDAKIKSEREKMEILHVIAKSKKIFTTYFSVTSFVIFWSTLGALVASEKRLLCEIWLPFDWNASNINFWIAFIYETFAIYMLICISVTNDFYAPMYMMILNGHFENLINRIRSIRSSPPKDSSEELIECIKQHEVLMKISNNLQPIISITMSLQFLITALALGMSVINIVYFGDNFFEMAKFLTVASVVFLHVLPCCYYGNQFSENSEKIMAALYECEWIDKSPEFKKLLHIFMGFNQKKWFFTAGKIIPINLATFVAITKFTYSLATFLNKMKE